MIEGNRVIDIDGDTWIRVPGGRWTCPDIPDMVSVTETVMQTLYGPVTEEPTAATTLQKLHEKALEARDAAHKTYLATTATGLEAAGLAYGTFRRLTELCSTIDLAMRVDA